MGVGTQRLCTIFAVRRVTSRVAMVIYSVVVQMQCTCDDSTKSALLLNITSGILHFTDKQCDEATCHNKLWWYKEASQPACWPTSWPNVVGSLPTVVVVSTIPMSRKYHGAISGGFSPPSRHLATNCRQNLVTASRWVNYICQSTVFLPKHLCS